MRRVLEDTLIIDFVAGRLRVLGDHYVDSVVILEKNRVALR